MTFRTTGEEFRRFWSDNSWCPTGEGKYAQTEYGYVEDEAIYVNDSTEPLDPAKANYASPESMRDTDEVKVVSGYLHVNETGENIPLTKVFNDWKKRQDTVSMVVHVPVDKVDLVRIALSGIPGVKIG